MKCAGLRLELLVHALVGVSAIALFAWWASVIGVFLYPSFSHADLLLSLGAWGGNFSFVPAGTALIVAAALAAVSIKRTRWGRATALSLMEMLSCGLLLSCSLILHFLTSAK